MSIQTFDATELANVVGTALIGNPAYRPDLDYFKEYSEGMALYSAANARAYTERYDEEADPLGG